MKGLGAKFPDDKQDILEDLLMPAENPGAVLIAAVLLLIFLLGTSGVMATSDSMVPTMNLAHYQRWVPSTWGQQLAGPFLHGGIGPHVGVSKSRHAGRANELVQR
jgi:hypothetical protein